MRMLLMTTLLLVVMIYIYQAVFGEEQGVKGQAKESGVSMRRMIQDFDP